MPTFLDLPAELRQRIYDYALPERVTIGGRLRVDAKMAGLHPVRMLNLPSVHKQILAETGYQSLFQTTYDYYGYERENKLRSTLSYTHRLWRGLLSEQALHRPAHHRLVHMLYGRRWDCDLHYRKAIQFFSSRNASDLECT